VNLPTVKLYQSNFRYINITVLKPSCYLMSDYFRLNSRTYKSVLIYILSNYYVLIVILEAFALKSYY